MGHIIVEILVKCYFYFNVSASYKIPPFKMNTCLRHRNYSVIHGFEKGNLRVFLNIGQHYKKSFPAMHCNQN